MMTSNRWCVWLLCMLFAAEASQAAAPNIVLIMADDLGYGDTGCYGQRLIQTPNIDRLAAEGMRFTQAYAGSSVCTPSRAALMTGLHSGHSAARDNIPHYATYLQESDVTIAEVLRTAGYRCGGVGKWSLGDAGTVGRATNQGFDMWLGYLNQDHAHYYFPEYLDDGEGRMELAGNRQSHRWYSHDLMAERGLQFIREAAPGPFFFYAAFTLPHFSATAEDEDGLSVPSTDPYSDRDWDGHAKKYAAMIHRLDRDVGRIVDLIDSLELREQTLIIFTSDNGGNSNVARRFNTSGPLRGFKRDLTEGGLRVPFIARWPGTIPEHETSDQVIAFQDLFPTFAQLAGQEVNSRQQGLASAGSTVAGVDVDGISIVSALQGTALAPPRGYLYWDYGHCRQRYDQAVRLGDWKGLRLGRQAEIELYDLKNDLGEQHNVAAQHPQIVRRMADIMRAAPVADPRYPIGKLYDGHPLWQPDP